MTVGEWGLLLGAVTLVVTSVDLTLTVMAWRESRERRED